MKCEMAGDWRLELSFLFFVINSSFHLSLENKIGIAFSMFCESTSLSVKSAR